MMDADTKARALARLRRIEGQVQGIRRMIEEDKYCVDVLLQLSAVRGALDQVARIVLQRHVESCVAESLRTGSERDRSRKIAELMRVFSRHGGLAGR
jgi:DNA-binding FrmR family transcriptional regulator